jgi:hypothetical protein
LERKLPAREEALAERNASTIGSWRSSPKLDHKIRFVGATTKLWSNHNASVGRRAK